MEENKYYVYLHIKETNGEPFYVGKGVNTNTHRNYRYKSKNGRSTAWTRIVNKYGFDIIFLETNLSESDAFERENYWIERIGRRDLGNGPLVNHTDGGEGISGRKHSEETKNKIRESKLGQTHSDETKEKLSKLSKGRIISDEQKEKISNTLKGHEVSEETRNKISIKNIGRVSPRKGIVMSEEQKKKISDSKKRTITK